MQRDIKGYARQAVQLPPRHEQPPGAKAEGGSGSSLLRLLGQSRPAGSGGQRPARTTAADTVARPFMISITADAVSKKAQQWRSNGTTGQYIPQPKPSNATPLLTHVAGCGSQQRGLEGDAHQGSINLTGCYKATSRTPYPAAAGSNPAHTQSNIPPHGCVAGHPRPCNPQLHRLHRPRQQHHQGQQQEPQQPYRACANLWSQHHIARHLGPQPALQQQSALQQPQSALQSRRANPASEVPQLQALDPKADVEDGGLLVLGNSSKRNAAKRAGLEGGRLRQLRAVRARDERGEARRFNHWDDGSGTWDCDTLGIDGADECNLGWEGVGSTTVGPRM